MSVFQIVLWMDKNDRLQIGCRSACSVGRIGAFCCCISCLIEFAEGSATIYSVDGPCMPIARRSCVLTPV